MNVKRKSEGIIYAIAIYPTPWLQFLFSYLRHASEYWKGSTYWWNFFICPRANVNANSDRGRKNPGKYLTPGDNSHLRSLFSGLEEIPFESLKTWQLNVQRWQSSQRTTRTCLATGWPRTRSCSRSSRSTWLPPPVGAQSTCRWWLQR